MADGARLACVAVILGTERVTNRGLQITACVINPNGAIAGWQDKGQIDPSEEGITHMRTSPNQGAIAP